MTNKYLLKRFFMTIKNIINIENNRSDNDFFTIHLFKEGNWWGGYELSAFLCHKYKNKLSDKLKVTKKFYKNEKVELIKIGLMQSSFDKYLPNNTEYLQIIDDSHITINAAQFIDIDINKDNYQILVNDLKNTLTCSIKQNDNDATSSNVQNVTLPIIISDILSFNLENKTQEELITFIKDLKTNLTKTFVKMLY